MDNETEPIYSVTDIAEGAVEREEFFDDYESARTLFNVWESELREYNLSEYDGVFLWDMSLYRTVAEYSGKKHDGGSLTEYGT